jgi:HEAT repeat protein
MFAAALVACALLADQVAWEKEFDAAFAAAKTRNVPVLVCFNMNGEPASDGMVNVYKDPEFVARSKDFVCIIASTFFHNPEESTAPCPRFGGITCAEHHKLEIKTSDAFIGTDAVISPQHVLVSPDKKVLTRRAYVISKNELLKMMTVAEKALRAGAGGVGEQDVTKQIDDLIKIAKDRNAERRKPAIAELGKIDDLRARDALFSLLNPKMMDDTRADALDALATKGNYDALPSVIERLGDSNTNVVRHAIVALEKIGLPTAIAPLTKLWKKKPMAMVACEIPRALVGCDPKNAEVQTLVKKACVAKESLVELHALVALRALPPDDETRKILTEKLTDNNGNVRGVAVWTIGGLRDAAMKAPLEAQLAKEANADVRACMELALKSLALDPKAKPLPELEMMLDKFLESDFERS